MRATVNDGKKRQGKLLLNIVKDKAEVMASTSFDDLHKHGYRPYMRWGSLKETLTAACILESGILERARRTGKLHVWDPFCGSGTILIELMQMVLGRPCRTLTEDMPFENWPIHSAKAYEEFKREIEEFKKVDEKDKVDIWLIGSDISLKAIETAEKNIDHANLDQFYHNEQFKQNIAHPRLNNPIVYQAHWPANRLQLGEEVSSHDGREEGEVSADSSGINN